MKTFFDIGLVVFFLLFIAYGNIVGMLYGGGHPNDQDDPRRVIVAGLIISAGFGFFIGTHF